MRHLLAKLTLNQRLALVAFLLGAVAAFADVTPRRVAVVDAKELLASVARQEDHVTPADLAAWIVEGRADYRLIDLRDAAAFAKYHIPTAESLPLAEVADGGLARNEKLVLYGQGVVHAAQAFMVLRGQGYGSVYTLLGGLDAWMEEVLFPVMPLRPSPEERARFERSAQLARFFGGQPRAAAAPGAEPQPLAIPAPADVVAPTLPAGAGLSSPKKKREGC